MGKWTIKKFWRPTRLLTRGIIMIIFPVLLTSIMVGFLIVERYYADMTNQLSSHVISDIHYAQILEHSNGEGRAYLTKKGYFIVPTALEKNRFSSFDLSGRMILGNFQEEFGESGTYIDSHEASHILISVQENTQTLTLWIKRSALAPINPQQILLNTMGFSILLTFISVLYLRAQTRSILSLSHAARAFGRGLSVDYQLRGSDEVRAAGRAFLAMRTRIERQRKGRNLMLSGLSHDLRTPIARMKLALEMMDAGPEKELLLDDMRDLEGLVASFLGYAANDASENVETVDLSPFLADVVKHYPKARFMRHGDVYRIDIKPQLFRRAIENLLGNAERYAQNIHVSISEAQGEIKILIDDDGPGIPESQRELALTAFSRLDSARSQNDGLHAGLGLGIASDAIRQHGGDIVLDDSPMGGLRVQMSLPGYIK